MRYLDEIISFQRSSGRRNTPLSLIPSSSRYRMISFWSLRRTFPDSIFNVCRRLKSKPQGTQIGITILVGLGRLVTYCETKHAIMRSFLFLFLPDVRSCRHLERAGDTRKRSLLTLLLITEFGLGSMVMRDLHIRDFSRRSQIPFRARRSGRTTK